MQTMNMITRQFKSVQPSHANYFGWLLCDLENIYCKNRSTLKSNWATQIH